MRFWQLVYAFALFCQEATGCTVRIIRHTRFRLPQSQNIDVPSGMRSENTSHRKCPPRLLRCVRRAKVDLCVYETALCDGNIYYSPYSPIANLFVVESVENGSPPQYRFAFAKSVRPVGLISSRSSRQLALYINHEHILDEHTVNAPLISHQKHTVGIAISTHCNRMK